MSEKDAIRRGHHEHPETNAWGARQLIVPRRCERAGDAARCVYCGRRCASQHLACYQCADLPALDARYTFPFMDSADLGEAAQALKGTGA